MNVKETEAFFRPLGWELKPSDASAKTRWDMIRDLGGDRKLVLSFYSLPALWRHWRSYTRRATVFDPLLNYLVEQYRSGDQRVRASVMDWVIHSKRGKPTTRTAVGRLWIRAAAIEADALRSLTRWRSALEALLRQPQSFDLPYAKFLARLNLVAQSSHARSSSQDVS